MSSNASPLHAAQRRSPRPWRQAIAGPALRVARAELSTNTLLLLIAFFLALTQNHSFAEAVARSLPHPFAAQDWRIAVSAFVTLVNLILLWLIPFSAARLVKPAAITFLVVASVCSYFMDAFGVVIDRSMIVNAARTDAHEAADLLAGAFWTHVAVFGVLPSVAVWHVRLRRYSPWSELRRRLVLLGAVLAVQAAFVGLQYNELAFWGRTHRDVRLLTNPTYPLYSAGRYLKSLLPDGPARPPMVIAADAVRATRSGTRPFLLVLVVGETARAQNFQLNGYARATNPRLSRIPDIVNFGNVSSCGTATAESVPCMFSDLSRRAFSRDRARARENLLDVLSRVGVRVEWWDNDSGCQGVCERVGARMVDKLDDPALCARGECRDGILLQDLPDFRPRHDALLVLHMKGSHGPAYFKRYPESARQFKPDCRDENVQRCARGEIINAYDNSLVYTDSVLADLIAQLQRNEAGQDSAVIYVSDHGESLGENGIYLHGLPYMLAPAEQTRVPMLAWFSPGTREALDLDLGCLRSGSGHPTSHDNLFHTVLGLFSVKTQDYDKSQDLLAPCVGPRRAPGSTS